MRLLFNDSTVSLRNMFLVMKQGWKASTISAAEYAAMQRSIIAQGKAGLAGRGVGNAMLYHEWMRSHQGQYLGKVMGKEDKTGRDIMLKLLREEPEESQKLLLPDMLKGIIHYP